MTHIHPPCSTWFCSVVYNGDGYGLTLDNRLPFQFSHSIVSGNRALSGSTSHRELGGYSADIEISIRAETPRPLIRSLGHNIVWPDDTWFSRMKTTSDMTVDLRVYRRFGSHGGFAPSHPLRYDSPAIDAGTADAAGILRSMTTYLGGTSIHGMPLTDQRGTSRPYGPAVDIGAFEYDGPFVYDWDRKLDRDVLNPKEFENRFDFKLKLDGLMEMEGDDDEEEKEEAFEKLFQQGEK